MNLRANSVLAQLGGARAGGHVRVWQCGGVQRAVDAWGVEDEANVESPLEFP